MGSSAAAAAAAAAAADSAQWLSVKEETIFLHDGLIRVTDLAELPSEILGAPEAADTDLEVSEAAPGLRHQISPPAPHSRGRALSSPLHPDPEAHEGCPSRCVWAPGRQVRAAPRVCRPPASLPPRGLNPRRGFHLWVHFERSDYQHFIRPSPGTALKPRRSRRRLPGPVSLPPRTPWTHLQGTPRLLSFGDILILTLYTPPTSSFPSAVRVCVYVRVCVLFVFLGRR